MIWVVQELLKIRNACSGREVTTEKYPLTGERVYETQRLDQIYMYIYVKYESCQFNSVLSKHKLKICEGSIKK